MKVDELQAILQKHLDWLNGIIGGKRANLCQANLSGADLREADLREADLSGANLSGADLRKADLSGADLSGANLSGADLRQADLSEANLWRADLSDADLNRARLRRANLRGADLDYSCLPLWCGSLSAQFDDRQLRQIAYHLVSAGLKSKNASEETKAELAKIIEFANGFHQVEECGKLCYTNDFLYVIDEALTIGRN